LGEWRKKDAELHPDCSPHEPASIFFACAKAAQHRSRCRRATVLRGAVLANDSDIAREAQFVLLDRTGEVTLEANNDATVLILSGAPIDEPVIVHGPFVINTADEIRQAMIDFQSGRFGAVSAET
jgi:redox-sensitive bicupin YhaK (pirin superfamily)